MWRASRPAPSAIWWRQLVPQAASSVSGGGGAHLRQHAEFADPHRDVVMLGFEAERAGHAAAGRIEGLDLSSGISRSASTAASTVPNAFWWQWPCNSARPARHRRERQLEAAGLALGGDELLEQQGAWRRAPWPRRPGSIAGNSSRRVNRQAGSSPTIGVPAAIAGASASSMRRASLRASSTSPAARKVRPQHSGRPTAGSGVVDAVAGAGQHPLGGARVLRLEIAVEGVDEQHDLAAGTARRRCSPRRDTDGGDHSGICRRALKPSSRSPSAASAGIRLRRLRSGASRAAYGA